MSNYYIGIDVGSYSVRSGLFLCTNDNCLKLLKKHEIPIYVFHDEINVFEQSSENIWDAACVATQKIISEAEINPSVIKGVGFDATCSLVALDINEKPLSVSKTKLNDRNIIMWMDLRAKLEAEFINKLNIKVLKTVGGKISVEMQPPKLMWLKKNIPGFMDNVGCLFDLPDYLTYRATGDKTRSLCSVTCKWMFDVENNCWDREFWESCRLSELCENNFSVIGNKFSLPGSFITTGLSEKAANELGLHPYIRVPASLIDAYAGVFGALTTRKQLITIAGTSTCHMLVTSHPIYIPGIWGPYKNVLLKDHYVLEAGQITVGNLLDRVLQFSDTSLSHSGAANHLLSIVCEINSANGDIFNLSSDQWYRINILTKDIHINPDFSGNRSPRSDPDIRGSMMGLSIDSSEQYVAKLYLATIQAIMYGFKEILDQLLTNQIEIESIALCGGLSKNSIYARVLADVSGIPVVLTQNEDLVLLGAAKLNLADSIELFQENNSTSRLQIIPDVSLAEYHKQKFTIYKKIIDFQCAINNLMH